MDLTTDDTGDERNAMRRLVESMLSEVAREANARCNGAGSEVTGLWSVAASQLLNDGALEACRDPRRFLWGVLYHKLSDHQQQQGRRRGNETFDDTRHSPTRDDGAEATIIRREEQDLHRKLLADLNHEDRQVLELNHDPQFAGWNSEQKAAYLGLSSGKAFRKKVQRLNDQLRQQALRLEALDLAIGQLPQQHQRELLRLKHFHGLSIPEMVKLKNPTLTQPSPERERSFARLIEEGEKELPPELLAGRP